MVHADNGMCTDMRLLNTLIGSAKLIQTLVGES
jgi:hypothetical protein